jgi:hypothetical protein
MGEVCARLQIAAEYVVFGHMHRAGPRDADDPGRWAAPNGARLVSTGSWTDEPALATADGRYRPGTGVRVDADGPPRAVTLVDTVCSREVPGNNTGGLKTLT